MQLANIGSLLSIASRERTAIVSVENPISITVPNGTAFGSLVFQSNVEATLTSGFQRSVPVSYALGSYDGNTDGVYALTGTLAPVAPVTNPLGLTATINVWVIPAGFVWWDFVDKAKVTGGVDNIGRIVTQTTGKTLCDVIQSGTTLARRPSWNGEGTYYTGNSKMIQSGATSVLKALSDGTQFTEFLIWKQVTLLTTAVSPIMDATAFTTNSIGLGVFVDNRTGSGFSYNVRYFIGKGVAGQAPINFVSANNIIAPGDWCCLKVVYDGSTINISISKNGGSFSVINNTAPAFTFSASNPTNVMGVGNYPTVGSSGNKMYIKHFWAEDSAVTGATLTNLENWAKAMCQENRIVRDANVYGMVGQSNQAGRGLNSAISAELDAGAIGAKILKLEPTPVSHSITSDSYWSDLDLGINQTFESISTLHGAEMRFGYEMNILTENCWILKLGEGGTPIQTQGTYPHWNISSATLLYNEFKVILQVGFDEITHVFRKTPVWRGLDIMQGETDAILTGAGAVYKANWQATINGWIDYIVGEGYTINKLRIFFWQITDVGGAAYDPTEFAAIKAAQVAFPTTYFADHPSRTANVKGIATHTTDDLPLSDTQHYSAAGQDTRGRLIFDYFSLTTAE